MSVGAKNLLVDRTGSNTGRCLAVLAEFTMLPEYYSVVTCSWPVLRVAALAEYTVLAE